MHAARKQERALKIKHLLDAIEIDSLDPRRFSQHLIDAWQRIRFSEPEDGYSGSDAIGAALIGTNNFAWKSSGWFDRNGVTFPAELLPQGHEELRAHLEWMIDCRRDGDTLKYILNAVNRRLQPTGAAGKSAVRRMALGDLVVRLERLKVNEPRIFEALLTGRLSIVSDCLKAKHERLEKIEHVNTIMWMVIVWALFDLQLIAYRLFHAEWNALDGGMDSPENMTFESLQKIAREMSDMAGRAAKAFRVGAAFDEVDPQLRAYIDRHGLLESAMKNAAKIGIDEEALRTGAFTRKDLLVYLRYLQHRLSKVLGALEKRTRRPRLSLVGYAHHAAGVSKTRYAPKAQREGDGRSLEIKQSAATVRFSVTGVTALLYAVEGIVEELGSLPTRGKIERGGSGFPAGATPLFHRRQKTQLTTELFTIYRDLFVRPAKNGRDEIVTSEYHHLATEAEATIAAKRPDPGLEPLLAEWQARSMKPLYGGVPARRLLAQGIDHGGLDRDIQEPATWQPKRVAAERKGDTRALRALRENSDARRHFKTRADNLDADFGDGVSGRFRLSGADPTKT